MKLYEELQRIENRVNFTEHDIDPVWVNFIRKSFGDKYEIKTDYKSDGFLFDVERDMYIVIMEFKRDKLLGKNNIDLNEVIVQVIYYLKKVEKDGKILPKVVLIGDVNEVVIFPTYTIEKYLRMENVDWNIAASEAYKSNRDMLDMLKDDVHVKFKVENVDVSFNEEKFINNLKRMVYDSFSKIKITKINIGEVFVNHIKGLFVDANDSTIFNFLQIMKGNYALAIKKRNKSKYVLYIEDGNVVQVNRDKYAILENTFELNMSNREFKEMLRNKDEFEDSVKRVKEGIFYTPLPFVDLAHQYIEKEFGKNWKSEYSVYDPAWGMGNLTRDYVFDDLYCSTLDGDDLKLAKNFNKGSRKFQMDFLNDDLPEFMVEAFKDKSKKWIVFMNPPYKNGPSGINHNNGVGFNVSKTSNKLDMKKDGVNGNDLYVQFIYKAIKLRSEYGADLTICVFSKATYLNGKEGKGLRKYLRNNNVEFKCGFLVTGKVFKGLDAKWPVSFTILK